MMKKVLYGVVLTLLACASVGSLQSCKDDVSDLKTQTSYDLNNLKLDIEKQLAALEEKINKKADKDGNATLEDLKAYATLKYVNQLIFGTASDVADQDKLNKIIAEGGLLKMIEGALSSIPEACSCDLTQLKEDVKNMKDLLYPEGEAKPADYGDSANMIAYLLGKIGANQKSMEAIMDYLGLEEGEDGLPAYKQKLQDQLEDMKTELEETDKLNDEQFENLLKEVQKIENDFLQAINDRIDSLITSIKVERAISPVFGDLSLPVGIKSNVLFNWYGYSDRGGEVSFPTAEVGLVGEGVKLPNGAPTMEIPAGYFDENVELGNVYVTLNPVGHIFNGTELTFTTSAGKDLDFKVTLTPSEYELMHGYTRADVTGNGFYEGKVTVSSENIESIKLSLDDKLMTAMKNAVKDQTKRNAASLIKALYDQMSGLMPAYALRYDWTSKYYTGNASMSTETSGEGDDQTTTEVPNWNSSVSEKAYAVLSSYDLAVAAARPLGFNFLQGEGASSNKIPTIGNIDNFVKELIDKNLDKINIQGKDMEIDGYKIGFANGKVYIDVINGKLVATVTGVTVNGVELAPVKTDGYDDPAQTSAQINKKLSEAIAEAMGKKDDERTVAKVEASVDIALLQMQKQINEVLADLNGQIHDAFDGISDSATSYLDKAKRAVDLYNKVANKINNFLKDPNHYLQAAVFYKTNSNIGILSSNPNSPTVFNGNGNAITLYLSTYTGEIIAPAYKKYVAVTAGSNADAINGAEKLNTILDGSEIAVEVPVANFKSGEVYELTYQAVDYRGFYSTRKCYIKVAK